MKRVLRSLIKGVGGLGNAALTTGDPLKDVNFVTSQLVLEANQYNGIRMFDRCIPRKGMDIFEHIGQFFSGIVLIF